MFCVWRKLLPQPVAASLPGKQQGSETVKGPGMSRAQSHFAAGLVTAPLAAESKSRQYFARTPLS